MNVCRKGETPFWLIAQVLESDCPDKNSNSVIYLLVFLDSTSLNLSFLFCQTGVISTLGFNLRMNMKVKHVAWYLAHERTLGSLWRIQNGLEKGQLGGRKTQTAVKHFLNSASHTYRILLKSILSSWSLTPLS